MIDMNNRLYSTDQSLNKKLNFESTEDWQDLLVDEKDNQDVLLEKKNQLIFRKELLTEAMKVLNEREREIIAARRLNEKPIKLEELSKKYKISRERVRQIEEKAFEKLQNNISAKSD